MNNNTRLQKLARMANAIAIGILILSAYPYIRRVIEINCAVTFTISSLLVCGYFAVTNLAAALQRRRD